VILKILKYLENLLQYLLKKRIIEANR